MVKEKLVRKEKEYFFYVKENIFQLYCLIPTGSMKELNLFILRLLSKGRLVSKIVTKIVLKQATSSTGITYSRVKLSRKEI